MTYSNSTTGCSFTHSNYSDVNIYSNYTNLYQNYNNMAFYNWDYTYCSQYHANYTDHSNHGNYNNIAHAQPTAYNPSIGTLSQYRYKRRYLCN